MTENYRSTKMREKTSMHKRHLRNEKFRGQKPVLSSNYNFGKILENLPTYKSVETLADVTYTAPWVSNFPHMCVVQTWNKRVILSHTCSCTVWLLSELTHAIQLAINALYNPHMWLFLLLYNLHLWYLSSPFCG
jgi:hypothetical protein